MKVLLPEPVAPALEALSPLEEGLRGPGAAQLREQTLAQLKELAQRARVELLAGVPSARHNELAALIDATLAAQEVLESYASPVSKSPMPTPARIG